MRNARLLARALAEPGSVTGLSPGEWTELIAVARAESLAGSLAHRLQAIELPPKVAALLADARRDSEQARTQALWEAEMARRALAPTGVPVILLKGTAYAAAGLEAAIGRSIGDLDILVPRGTLDEVQQALLAAGWEWVKPDPYDDLYYRRWMHELPPLIHRERDRMIDVHHTILPLTARPKPLPLDLIDKSRPLHGGLRVLSPEHMILHAAAHLIADGDLAGGLRNLWDIDRMCREFSRDQADFCPGAVEEAHAHGLGRQVMTALRLAAQIFGTPLTAYDGPAPIDFSPRRSDRYFRARLLARDGWGRETRKGLRFAFYVRSHWLRMPPLMLARHLWLKARR
ncbi:MAG TPA: nucleotidyltransferase family protein [Allosphingosinicella sp.]